MTDLITPQGYKIGLVVCLSQDNGTWYDRHGVSLARMTGDQVDLLDLCEILSRTRLLLAYW
jgi:hypothetical protein